MQVQPSLAKSWKFNESGTEITFTIRDDVYFHDNEVFPESKGRKLTAHDIVYSFDRLIDPNTASSGAWIFNEKVVADKPFEAPELHLFL